MIWWTLIKSKFARWCEALVVFLAAIVYVYTKGRGDGKALEVGKETQEIQHGAKVAAQEQSSAYQLPVGQAEKELSKEWNRP